MDKRAHLPLNVGITKNCRVITLTIIAAMIYNALLFTHIRPKVKRFFGKTRKFSDKSIYNSSNSNNVLVRSSKEWMQKISKQRCCIQISLGIRFHTERKYGANTSRICFL